MRPVRSVPAWTGIDLAFAARLPDAHARLHEGGLVVHLAIAQVVLHGSRGLAGGCGLGSFDVVAWGASEVCPYGSGRDCFGAYKLQRGFGGFVENAGIDVRRMQPCVAVWKRAKTRLASSFHGR